MHAEKHQEWCETAHISISVIDQASFIGVAPDVYATVIRTTRFRLLYRLFHFDLNPRIAAIGNQSRQSRNCNKSSASRMIADQGRAERLRSLSDFRERKLVSAPCI